MQILCNTLTFVSMRGIGLPADMNEKAAHQIFSPLKNLEKILVQIDGSSVDEAMLPLLVSKILAGIPCDKITHIKSGTRI